MPRKALLALALAACPLPAQPGDEKPDTKKAVARVLEGINAFRAEKKLPPLKLNAELTRFAQSHADAMAKADRYDDDDVNPHVLNGKGFKERMAEGYKYPLAAAAEIAARNARPDPVGQALKDWRGSQKGHYGAIISPTFTETGVGVAVGKSGRWYFVGVLAKPR
jgi:uncharacterized protein YkwD